MESYPDKIYEEKINLSEIKEMVNKSKRKRKEKVRKPFKTSPNHDK